MVKRKQKGYGLFRGMRRQRGRRRKQKGRKLKQCLKA